MAQVQHQYSKVVKNVVCLQQQMQAAQWPGAVVISQGGPSFVTAVVTDDAQPDPGAFVLAYSDPATLTVTSSKPVGSFGLPSASADGVDKHLMTIQAVNPADGSPSTWSGVVLVQPKAPIGISPTQVQVTNGVGTFEVGPSTIPGEFDLSLKDQADTAGWSRIQTRVAFL